jgi:quinoprotein glucose dehydrogenase
MNSLAGKILRVTPEGQIPPDNPFPNSPIWTLGHRNTQGIAWHPQSRDLFSSEHGPSGEWGLHGMDKVNLIRKGANYGWPRAWGKTEGDQYPDPIAMWQRATPPAGIAFNNGELFVSTLGSEALIRIELSQTDDAYEVKRIERWFIDDRGRSIYGRLRDAVTGPDGSLYVLTSNRDGRGQPREGDDQILRITRVTRDSR